MDWSDPAVQFGSRQLDADLRDFCGPTLEDIRSRSLELLDSLRASRVTLEYLRKVSSVDVVSGRQPVEERTSPSSLTTPLDDKATNKVKGYLRRRVEKLKSTVAAEFRSLVPQNRDAFEKGFDAFVEKCMDAVTHIRNTWFEEHVASGAAQPQLWKIYIAFQRQLRDACEAHSRKPLPPPLFATKEDDEAPMPPERLRRACHRQVATHFERDGFKNAQSSCRHCRAQSCAEFGRLVPPHPYVFHGGLVNIPCLPVQPAYHVRHESVPGVHAAGPNDVRRDFTEQWIAQSRLQDDNDLLYSCYDNAMFPAGFHFVVPGMYSGKPPKTVGYARDFEHGN